MTTDSTRDHTLRPDQTLARPGRTSHRTAGGTDGDGESAPNGYWVGAADDPDRYELLGDGISGGEGTTFKARYHGEAGEPLIVAVKQLH
jgi:hypothetical protein